MPLVEPTQTEAPEVDDGLYELTCIEKPAFKTVTDDPYGNNSKVEFQLRVGDLVDPTTGKPIVLRKQVNRKWGEKATLFKWAQAFGLQPDPRRAIDTDDFDGKTAMGLLRTEEVGEWPRITEMMPVRKGQKAVSAASAPRTTAPEDLPWEDAEADANALESFYEAGDQYARRSEIKSTSQRMFNNRLPEALTTQEREELLAELKRGAS